MSHFEEMIVCGEGRDHAKPKDGSIYLLDFKYDELILNDRDIGILEVEAEQYLWLNIEDDVENARERPSPALSISRMYLAMHTEWNQSVVSDPESGPYSIYAQLFSPKPPRKRDDTTRENFIVVKSIQFSWGLEWL